MCQTKTVSYKDKALTCLGQLFFNGDSQCMGCSKAQSQAQVAERNAAKTDSVTMRHKQYVQQQTTTHKKEKKKKEKQRKREKGRRKQQGPMKRKVRHLSLLGPALTLKSDLPSLGRCSLSWRWPWHCWQQHPSCDFFLEQKGTSLECFLWNNNRELKECFQRLKVLYNLKEKHATLKYK